MQVPDDKGEATALRDAALQDFYDSAAGNALAAESARALTVTF